MYKILGSDQKEYGPVSAEVLQQWIAEHRVVPETLIMAEGGTEWKPLSSFPEFSQASAPPTPPTPGLSMSEPEAAPRPYAPQWGPGAPGMVVPAKTSGLAITSLVLGILGLFTCGITGLFGLITGIIATSKIGKSQGRLTGKGMAIAGMCIGGVTLIMLPFWAGLTLPALAKAKTKAQRINCLSNLKMLGLGLRMYANDNSGKYPLANNWCDAIRNDVSSDKPFKCAAASQGQRCTYAYNAKLSGKREADVDPSTVMLFEIEGGWNISGGPELMLPKARHGGYNVSLADGSVMQVTPSQLSRLRWDP